MLKQIFFSMGLSLIVLNFALAQTHTGGTDIGEANAIKICLEASSKVESAYRRSCKRSRPLHEILNEVIFVMSAEKLKEATTVVKLRDISCNDQTVTTERKLKKTHCLADAQILSGLLKIEKHYKELAIGTHCTANFSQEDLQNMINYLGEVLSRSNLKTSP